MKKIKWWLLLIISVSYNAFFYFWLTPLKTNAAVMQLENDTILYGIAKKATTSSGYEVLSYVTLVLIVVCVYKLFFNKEKNIEID